MNLRHGALAVIAAALLALPACAGRTASEESNPDALSSTASSVPPHPLPESEVDPDEAPAPAEAERSYIQQLVLETVSTFEEPGMSDYEKAKAAFDYMIETTSLLDPVGLELWRIRGSDAGSPSYVENRSLSVLLFQLGKCEDYAATLTLLLQGMGLEAEYVPGLTYSTQGELVDHAWTVANIDGVWYHLDCQLEQNISRHGSMRYKYFMRGDATMRESHRWGQNLIDSRLLTAEQNEEIAQLYTPPACPQDFPTPARRSVTLADMPDVEAIETAIQAEFQEHERTHGPLEAVELNTIPPVFGLDGFGPPD